MDRTAFVAGEVTEGRGTDPNRSVRYLQKDGAGQTMAHGKLSIGGNGPKLTVGDVDLLGLVLNYEVYCGWVHRRKKPRLDTK